MRFVIEWDGVVFDLVAGWHRAHELAAESVGWSKLDRATFWRLMRTKGFQADFLPGARPQKFKDYTAVFERLRESDEIVSLFGIQSNVSPAFQTLKREGPCIGVTSGSNSDARRRLIEREKWTPLFSEFQSLNRDPRIRPVELKALANRDPRTVAVGASDAFIRSADAAELFAVGVSLGPVTPSRLQQAGARLVFPTLIELAEAASKGASRLVEAGLAPERLS